MHYVFTSFCRIILLPVAYYFPRVTKATCFREECYLEYEMTRFGLKLLKRAKRLGKKKRFTSSSVTNVYLLKLLKRAWGKAQELFKWWFHNFLF